MNEERRIDLHTHSIASDGRLTPTDLVQAARDRGLTAIGLTDHDTTSGLPEAEDAGSKLGVIIVPGVELSSTVDGREAHMLGYFIDPENDEFQTALADFVAQRFERVDRMIAKLAESERVEQVFVRHAFRFWMGRNETLNDAPVLQAAHKAYRDNGGSMKALITSLVTSDAFLYRKVERGAE